MFCSKDCRDLTYKNFNGKNELIADSLSGNDIRQKMLRIMSDSLGLAGSLSELQKLVSESHDKTVFDFDFSIDDGNEIKRNAFKSILPLLPKTDYGIEDYLKTAINMPAGLQKDFLVAFVSRTILIYLRNGAKVFGTDRNLPDGGKILPFVALVNNSCDPNIYATFVDNRCVFVVLKPIQANQQIFINYRFVAIETVSDLSFANNFAGKHLLRCRGMLGRKSF